MFAEAEEGEPEAASTSTAPPLAAPGTRAARSIAEDIEAQADRARYNELMHSINELTGRQPAGIISLLP